MQTFEHYLMSVCFDENLLDRDSNKQEYFDTWLAEQNTKSLIIYAEGWGRHIKLHILREVTKLTN